jgi:membrane-associated phospholipid phosphatase
LFLGEHYASDVVAGAVIGITLVWAFLKLGWLQSGFSTRLLAFAEAKPEVFYTIAFLISFEMAVLFDDVRVTARTVMHIAKTGSSDFNQVGLAAFATLSVLVIVGYLVFLAFMRRAHLPSSHSGRLRIVVR